MKDTDKILVDKEYQKLIGTWTDEMINELSFRLDTYLIDEDFKDFDGEFDNDIEDDLPWETDDEN